MADLAAFLASMLGDTVSAEELYDKSLFKPSEGANPNDTFEALNGLLDSENYGGADGSITPDAIQPGTFARGEYDGSDEWEFMSAQQTGNTPLDPETGDDQWIGHALLSKRIFVPWENAVVLYGYQAWFTHTAVQWWLDDETWANEKWFVRLYVDNVCDTNQTAQLPIMAIPHLREVGYRDSPNTAEDYDATSREPAGPGDQIDEKSHPGIGFSRRWRFVNKSGLLKVNGKGYHKIEVKLWPTCVAPDAEKMRCITRSSGIYVLVLRADSDLITGS